MYILHETFIGLSYTQRFWEPSRHLNKEFKDKFVIHYPTVTRVRQSKQIMVIWRITQEFVGFILYCNIFWTPQKIIKELETLIITLYLAEYRAYLIHKILMAFTHQVRCIVHLYIVVTSSEGHKPRYVVADL